MPYRRSPAVAVAFDPLESRLLRAKTPVAINFNDEAMWSENFATYAAQAKALGVQAVRIWAGVDDYAKRPNAWDPVSEYGAVTAGEVSAEDAQPNGVPQTMLRAFQLKAMGFKVLMVLQTTDGAPPESADAVKGYVRHMMDATQTPTSTVPLKDVVDDWEIGNEPDSAGYWAPSGVDKTAGLKSYVDDLLIPAAEELHANGDHENVVSAGVSGDPADLATIVNELKARDALDDVDALGFHPYGYVTSTYDGIAASTAKVVKTAAAVGKPLIATEWNVRGFGTAGTHDAAWAAAVDSVYKNTILPNYDTAYYFTLVDDYDARGGSVSARPGGLLEHDGSVQVTPTSPVLTIRDYYRSPVAAHDPFYSMFKAWQYGTVAGTVTNASGGTGPASTVYVDLDGDGKQDAGEPSATSGATNGKYTLTFSVRDVPAGSYAVRLVAGSGADVVTGKAVVTLTNLATATADFVVKATNTPSATTGAISGVLWDDADGDGAYDAAEKATGVRTVFLDTDHDGVLDAGERSVQSKADGSYAFTGLATGTYAVARVFPAGWRLSNASAGYVAVTLAAGKAAAGVNLGSAATAAPAAGEIDGGLFTNAGVSAAMKALSWSAYVDADRDGKFDAGETSTAVDAWGHYALKGLTAGTYVVRLTANAGWSVTTPASGAITINLASGKKVADKNFVLAKA